MNLCNVKGEYELHESLNFELRGQTCMFGGQATPLSSSSSSSSSSAVLVHLSCDVM